jgi:hypothetical protein
MRKIGYFAAAAVVILIGLGMRGAPTTGAFIVAAGVDPSTVMTSAKDLPTTHYDGSSMVFN